MTHFTQKSFVVGMDPGLDRNATPEEKAAHDAERSRRWADAGLSGPPPRRQVIRCPDCDSLLYEGETCQSCPETGTDSETGLPILRMTRAEFDALPESFGGTGAPNPAKLNATWEFQHAAPPVWLFVDGEKRSRIKLR